jgi:hypothetical protein
MESRAIDFITRRASALVSRTPVADYSFVDLSQHIEVLNIHYRVTYDLVMAIVIDAKYSPLNVSILLLRCTQ